MPATVVCGGCGKSLKVRDEHLNKRMKCPQCSSFFVATDDDLDTPAGSGGTQNLVDRLFAQWPAVAGLGLMAAGIWVVLATHNLPGGRFITRAGLGLIGLGISSFGYWALSSSNDNYNF